MTLTNPHIEDLAELNDEAAVEPSGRPAYGGSAVDGEAYARRRNRRSRRSSRSRRSARRQPCGQGRAARKGPKDNSPRGRTTLLRRTLVAGILATATVTVVLAVPPLRGVAREISNADPGWIAVALALELASCAAYVVIFRLFFAGVPAGLAREVAWTEEASGALLPTGGLGALAIGGLLLRQAGLSTRRILENSSALFFLTSAINVFALVGGGVMLATGTLGGHDTWLLAGIPIALGVGSTIVTLAVPVILRRGPARRRPSWLVDVAAGIDGARTSLVTPNWRMLGALGYLGFDIAALGATFAATGHPIPVDVLVLGYIIGYIANILPVPGGFGVLEAGLAGTLILYGAPATQAAAAVIVYHAIAFWIPSLGGLLGYGFLRRREAPLDRRVAPGPSLNRPAPAAARGPAAVPR